MSKIGKKLIPLPPNVQIQLEGDLAIIKGPKGETKQNLPGNFKIQIQKDGFFILPKQAGSSAKSIREQSRTWGLYHALLQNMVTGVSEGFRKSLEFQGVGYKAIVKGQNLELGLGFSHPVLYTAPEGITLSVDKSTITVIGTDRQLVGQVAAKIRSYREPEPYKGSGIRYSNEIIKRKAGKKAVASG